MNHEPRSSTLTQKTFFITLFHFDTYDHPVSIKTVRSSTDSSLQGPFTLSLTLRFCSKMFTIKWRTEFYRNLKNMRSREREQNTNKNCVSFREQEQNENKKYFEYREQEHIKNKKNMRVLSSLI